MKQNTLDILTLDIIKTKLYVPKRTQYYEQNLNELSTKIVLRTHRSRPAQLLKKQNI